ncbi:hypothetical protein FXO38_28766 [Capsicum annuum]|nr:hypothetical protein FXO38_28766 [Capsicum annuum]
MRCQATEKVASVSLSLKTVKNFIYFEDNETATDSAHIDSWRVSSFSEVEKLVSVRIVILKLGSDDVHFAYRPFAHVFELASETAMLTAETPAILDHAVIKKVEGKAGSAKKLFLIAFNHRLAAMEGSWFGAWGLEKQL